MSFLTCIAKYLVEMVILAAIGGLGAFIGITLRKKKNAKADAAQADAAKE